MKLALVLDPLDSLKTDTDSSLAIMREAAQRGHALFVLEQGDILLRDGRVMLAARPFRFTNSAAWYRVGEPALHAPGDFDVILMRKDPPFDNEYVYSTYLLELAEAQDGRVFNSPRAIRDWNEKLSVARFPEYAPAFLVTRSTARIRDFLAEYGDIVIKPLDSMGGSGVFRLHQTDHNISVILETATHFERRTVMVQRYLPEIVQGDKRVLVIGGEPLPYALARIPKTGETRGNLVAGGQGIAQPLTVRDREIAMAIAPHLVQAGLFLVGLDIIGDCLTEINVTSPTCMVEIAAQTDYDPACLCVDALERLCDA